MLERAGNGPYAHTFTLTDVPGNGFPPQHVTHTYTFVLTPKTGVFTRTDSGYYYKKGLSSAEYPPQTSSIQGPVRYAG